MSTSVFIHQQIAKTFWQSLGLVSFLAFLGLAPLVQADDMTPAGVLNLVNAERTAKGLEPLSLNSTLSQAAEAKAKDMLKNDYFAHTSPVGQSPWYWIKRSGYSYQYAGENLAINYESAKSQHTAWMKSKTHRDNILNAKYRETGIAVVDGKIKGDAATITVEVFAAPRVLGVTNIPKTTAPAPSTEAAAPAVAPATDQESEAVTVPTSVVVPAPQQTLAPLAAAPRDTRLDWTILIAVGLLGLVAALPPLLFVGLGWRAIFSRLKPAGSMTG